MTTNQYWAVIALLACVFVGGAVYLGVDLTAVGRAVFCGGFILLMTGTP